MQRFPSALALPILALLLLTSSAYAARIDFDDLNSKGSSFGTLVDDHYQSLGIIFDVGYASDYWYTNGGHQTHTSIPTVVYGEADCSDNGVKASPVCAHFVVPGTMQPSAASFVSVSAAWTDWEQCAWLYGYDLSGAVVAMDTKQGFNSSVRLSIQGTSIYSFRVVFDNDDVNGIDDLIFKPVPEPSSILALLCGISGVGYAVLRRKSA